MNEGLHPLRLGEILDRTAQIYRSRFLVFLGIAAIPAGTMFVLVAGLFGLMAWIGANARNGNTPSAVVWVLVVILSIIVVPATLGTSALGEAAMTDASARCFLGYPITIRNAYKTAWTRGWRYVGLLILQGLAILVGPVIAFFGLMAVMIAVKVSGYASNDPSPLFGGIMFLGFAVLFAIAVLMLLRLCMAFPASVVEQATAWSALKRGTHLSHGTKGRILVLYILGLLLNQILAWAVAIPAVIVLAFIPGLQGEAHSRLLGMIGTVLIYGMMFVVRALTKPVYGIALVLFYFDQRIRKEGFDIEWMMQQAGMVPVAAAAAFDVTAVPAIGAPAEHVEQIPVLDAPGVAALETVPVTNTALNDNPGESRA